MSNQYLRNKDLLRLVIILISISLNVTIATWRGIIASPQTVDKIPDFRKRIWDFAVICFLIPIRP